MPSWDGFDVLDFDPLTGMKTLIKYDDATEETIIGTVQDVSPVLERAKRMRDDPSQPWRSEEKGELGWWKVGSIPLVIVEKWKRELGVDVFNPHHMPAVKRLLNDPDYAYLKTAPVRI